MAHHCVARMRGRNCEMLAGIPPCQQSGQRLSDKSATTLCGAGQCHAEPLCPALSGLECNWSAQLASFLQAMLPLQLRKKVARVTFQRQWQQRLFEQQKIGPPRLFAFLLSELWPRHSFSCNQDRCSVCLPFQGGTLGILYSRPFQEHTF